MRRYSYLLGFIGLSQIVSAYDLHEWGTFTTVSGSNGQLLAGLEVEEEHLPPFVYSHTGMKSRPSMSDNNQFIISKSLLKSSKDSLYLSASSFKGMRRANLRNVTVKMETPVIYFYGDDAPKVNVKVGFNGGTISQWYPNRKSGDTPNKVTFDELKDASKIRQQVGEREMVILDLLDFSKNYQGSIEWDVEVIPKSQADTALTFKPSETTTWNYPRVSDANMIKVGGEYEDFLFYRGIGNFPLPVVFSVDADETLHVENKSEEAIPFGFAFENKNGSFYYKVINGIEPGESEQVAENEWVKPKDEQLEVFQEMRKGLVAQGLTIEESNGMIKTWWKSYFGQPGLRVFWVVPQGELEKTLPLTVSPEPEKQVRVMVGRADVMRPRMEQKMIAALGTHDFRYYQQDRFILPYTNRLKQIVKKPVFQKLDEVNVANVYLTVRAKKGDLVLNERFIMYSNRKVNVPKLNLKGDWKVVGEDTLMIGDVEFRLNAERGLLTAVLPKQVTLESGLSEDFDSYEIQLPRAL